MTQLVATQVIHLVAARMTHYQHISLSRGQNPPIHSAGPSHRAATAGPTAPGGGPLGDSLAHSAGPSRAATAGPTAPGGRPQIPRRRPGRGSRRCRRGRCCRPPGRRPGRARSGGPRPARRSPGAQTGSSRCARRPCAAGASARAPGGPAAGGSYVRQSMSHLLQAWTFLCK